MRLQLVCLFMGLYFTPKAQDADSAWISTNYTKKEVNISMRDGKPFVHVHILLSDAEGKVFGGHLMKGTKLFACEVTIDEFEGEQLERGQDERTGLFLWKSHRNDRAGCRPADRAAP